MKIFLILLTILSLTKCLEISQNKIILFQKNTEIKKNSLFTKLRIKNSASIMVFLECVFDDFKIILIKLTNILNDLVRLDFGNITYQWLAILDIFETMSSC